MSVYISPKALKQIRKLPKIPQIAIQKKIVNLSSKDLAASKKIKGHKNAYRLRVGDYRIVVGKYGRDIHVILVGHRQAIYKILKKYFLI